MTGNERDPGDESGAERDADASARALSRLGKAVVPVEDAPRAEARRERLVPALSAFADGVFEQRRRRALAVRGGVAAGLLAAAAALFVVVGGNRAGPQLTSEPSASIRTADGAVQIGRAGSEPGGVASAATPLWSNDRVRTEAGRAEVSLRTGAAVELGPATEIELGPEADSKGAKGPKDAAEERVRIASGTIRLRVPRLGSGRLVVDTPNATVTVHGTVFTVEVKPAKDGAAAITSVTVTEGKVSVASGGREIFLGPTSSWSSAVAEASEPALAVDGAAPSLEKGATPEASAARSTLRAENALFRAALAAEREGHPARAIELVDALLARYPDSPLAGAARKKRASAEAALAGAIKTP